MIETETICKNCEYYYKEHCCSGDSDMCTYPVEEDYSCEWWEEKRMNDIEKAIKLLKAINHNLKVEHMIKDMNNEVTKEDRKEYREDFMLINVAISALEKQIPKNPQEGDVDFSTFVCPNCLSTIMYTDEKETHNYCLSCGQRMDWSVEE